MTYWIHEKGETIGPLRAVEVLQRAQSDTLVSNGQEWVQFYEHPAFPSCSSEEPKAARAGEVRPTMDESDKGEFWIWGKGHAIGPLKADELLARATGETLVSLGQEWISISQHPVFCKFASYLPADEAHCAYEGEAEEDSQGTGEISIRARPSRSEASTFESTVQGGFGDRGDYAPEDRSPSPALGGEMVPIESEYSGSRLNQKSTATTSGRHFQHTLPSESRTSLTGRLVLVAAIIMAILISFSFVFEHFRKKQVDSAASSNSSSDNPSNQAWDSDEGPQDVVASADGRWVYSKPFDLVSQQSDLNFFESEQEYFDDHREILAGWKKKGWIARLDGNVLWINPDYWLAQDRWQQAYLLEFTAELAAESLDPRDWEAEVRNAQTDDLLVSTSANGLRALWTAKGYLPESPPRGGPPDLESPMTVEERTEFTQLLIDYFKSETEGLCLMEGRYVMPAGFSKDGYGIIYSAVLTQFLSPGHEVMVVRREMVAVHFGFDQPEPSRSRDADFTTCVKKNGTGTVIAGKYFQGYDNVPNYEKKLKIFTEWKRLTSELNTPNRSAADQVESPKYVGSPDIPHHSPVSSSGSPRVEDLFPDFSLVEIDGELIDQAPTLGEFRQLPNGDYEFPPGSRWNPERLTRHNLKWLILTWEELIGRKPDLIPNEQNTVRQAPKDRGYSPTDFFDGWGNVIFVSLTPEAVTFLSAGPDETFANEEDNIQAGFFVDSYSPGNYPHRFWLVRKKTR